MYNQTDEDSIARIIVELAIKVRDDIGHNNAHLTYKAFHTAEMEATGFMVTQLYEVYMEYNGKRIWQPINAILIDNKLILETKANNNGFRNQDIVSYKTIIKYSPYKEVLLINFHDKDIEKGTIFLDGVERKLNYYPENNVSK